MWVYRRTDNSLFTVGYYKPDGGWEADSDHQSRESAAQRVHWLNGGNAKVVSLDAEDRYFMTRTRTRY